MPQADQTFASTDEWEAHADAWLAPAPGRGAAVLIDARGRLCQDAADLIRSESEGTFPVRWVWPDQLLNALCSEIAGRVRSDSRVARLERWCGLDTDSDYMREMTETNLERLARAREAQRAHVMSIPLGGGLATRPGDGDAPRG